MLRRRRGPDPSLAQLLVPDLGCLPARVRRASSGCCDLQVSVPTGALDGRDATLVAVDGQAVHGRLEVGFSPGHVRFTEDGVQRRRHDREAAELPALLVPDVASSLWRARTRDVGTGGVRVVDATGVPLGARLEVRLEVADELVSARARVIRAPVPSERALAFEWLAPADLDRLRAYLREVRRT